MNPGPTPINSEVTPITNSATSLSGCWIFLYFNYIFWSCIYLSIISFKVKYIYQSYILSSPIQLQRITVSDCGKWQFGIVNWLWHWQFVTSAEIEFELYIITTEKTLKLLQFGIQTFLKIVFLPQFAFCGRTGIFSPILNFNKTFM